MAHADAMSERTSELTPELTPVSLVMLFGFGVVIFAIRGVYFAWLGLQAVGLFPPTMEPPPV